MKKIDSIHSSIKDKDTNEVLEKCIQFNKVIQLFPKLSQVLAMEI